jgi:oxygen-independent coproporphyrinogen III oxidase
VTRRESDSALTHHLYLHVPFCARRCSYCDFAIAVRRDVPWQRYADAVHEECVVRDIGMRCAPLDTLYLGGGTPSRLGPNGVAATLAALRRHVELAPDAEVTLEANPEDISDEAVAAWQEAGINRLSIGIQSFDDTVLQWMHRVHDAARASEAVETVRRGGIARYSVDLIFAAPAALARDWTRDLDGMLALDADHVSLYGLTIEPGTPLGRWQARGEVQEADESRYEAEFLEAHARLTDAGYEHYEVSNFARPGRRARHNSAYWRAVPYVGLGPGAHDFDGRHRRWNLSAYAAWDRALREGQDPIEGREELTVDNRAAEAVYLGLRTVDGLLLEARELSHVAPWIEAGWAVLSETEGAPRLHCTATGWLRLDALAADLTAFRGRS